MRRERASATPAGANPGSFFSERSGGGVEALGTRGETPPRTRQTVRERGLEVEKDGPTIAIVSVAAHDVGKRNGIMRDGEGRNVLF